MSESGDGMDLDSVADQSESSDGRPKEQRDDLVNPFWMEERNFGKGEREYLSEVEIRFWKELIDKYLHPIDADKQKEVCSHV